MADAINRLCKAIPAELVREPSEEERALAAEGLAPEPWDGLSRVVELLHYWLIPYFWVAHRDPVSLWTDPRAREYWDAAFGDDHFQAGDPELADTWSENPHGREENRLYPRPEWQNPHGCVDFLDLPLDMFHQDWGNRLLPLLPKALQHEALDEALWRIGPKGGLGTQIVDTGAAKHTQWLKDTVPDWPRWAMADQVINDYPAYRSSVRQKALEQRLDGALPTTTGRQRL